MELAADMMKRTNLNSLKWMVLVITRVSYCGRTVVISCALLRPGLLIQFNGLPDKGRARSLESMLVINSLKKVWILRLWLKPSGADLENVLEAAISGS